MSSGQMWWGSLKPRGFLLVDSAGKRVVNHTFVAGDVFLIDTGQAGTPGDVDIGSECSHVSKGLYIWTPTSIAQTQVMMVAVLITDSTDTDIFIDNAIIEDVGGHKDAYFDAGLV